MTSPQLPKLEQLAEQEAITIPYPEREKYLDLFGAYYSNECQLYKKIKCEDCREDCKRK